MLENPPPRGDITWCHLGVIYIYKREEKKEVNMKGKGEKIKVKGEIEVKRAK